MNKRLSKIEQDIKCINEHIATINDELGRIWRALERINENQRWLKWLICGLFLIFFGLLVNSILG